MKGLVIFIFFCMFSAFFSSTKAQGIIYNYYYRVLFKDKGDYNINQFKATDLLSAKAILRREKYGISVPSFNDLPVYPDYINQIKTLGLTLHCTSKWMNSALFKSENPVDINKITNLTFVRNVKIVKIPVNNIPGNNRMRVTSTKEEYPPYNCALTMINGDQLHKLGFDGKGVTIAVLDGGFSSAKNLTGLESLFNRGGIKGTYDIVLNTLDVYSSSSHGSGVLSVLAGMDPGKLEGSAPGADYWLLRTEDVQSEFPVEEDYWARGAEFADSVGVDIITSSLGYFEFDDPFMNYTYKDMDGKTTFVTQAADIAASKGILVVNSIGNEGLEPWHHIIAPSDGDSVLSVGMVDCSGIICPLSSAGPTFDNRIKPDIVVDGVNVPVQAPDTIFHNTGNSLSCPIVSGMCACILQAVPMASNMNIISALHFSSDKFHEPDSLYGYGIPDMLEVIDTLRIITGLEMNQKSIIENDPVIAPNPFHDDIRIQFANAPVDLTIEILNYLGKIVRIKGYQNSSNNIFILEDLRNIPTGIYFLNIITPDKIRTFKIIKI